MSDLSTPLLRFLGQFLCLRREGVDNLKRSSFSDSIKP